MKTKNYILVIASVFALVFALGFLSAADTTLSLDQSTYSKSIMAGNIGTGTNGFISTSVSLKLNETTGNVTNNNWSIQDIDLTSTSPLFTETLGLLSFTPTLSLGGAFNITNTTTLPKTLTLQITQIPENQTAGTYTGSFTLSGNEVDDAGVLSGNSIIVTASVTITISNPGFCTSGSNSTGLELSKFDITNNGRGDDNKWYPLDTIEIEVKFENNKDSSGLDLYDLSDVTFELGIFDGTKDVAGDMIWISKDDEEFEFGDVNEGDDAKHIFEFRVNPAEFDTSGSYEVKVKAYPAGKESATCISDSSDMTSFGTSKYTADVSIKMAKDNNAVIVDEENFATPSTASCEQEVTFSADVWNTGSKDFPDQVLITLTNTALSVDQNVTLIGDLDQGEMTQATFTFNVPAGMTEKTYNLDMTTSYDWDADNSEYDEVSEDTFVFPLAVSGNCVLPEATMTASLESGGQAGQTLVVKATVTNSGTEDTTYTFAVSGYSDWASSATINNTLTLTAGESQDILVSFDVDKKTDAGDYTFNIETYAEGETILTQPVQVAIEGRKGLGLSNDNGAVAILIALISAAAIAIIIVLIVRASRKKSA